jgi:hypothetical protein
MDVRWYNIAIELSFINFVNANKTAAELLYQGARGAAGGDRQDQGPEQANVYATMAKKASLPTSPIQDVAIVFRKTADLRSTDQCKAFITAILAALRLGSPPLS